MDTKECRDRKYAKTDQDENGKKLCLLIEFYFLWNLTSDIYYPQNISKRNDLRFQFK